SSSLRVGCFSLLVFFYDSATPEIYTLSLHDALPIYLVAVQHPLGTGGQPGEGLAEAGGQHQRMILFLLQNAAYRRRLERVAEVRSEEHTSELQSRENLVCRLLLEKKKKIKHK